MSARDRLFRLISDAAERGGMWSHEPTEFLDAHRAEVLREAASKIRENAKSVRADEIARFGQTDYESDLQYAARVADADLIDPDIT